jgi:hypothetical protein
MIPACCLDASCSRQVLTATEKNEFRVSSERPPPAAPESRVSPEWPKPQTAESRVSEKKTRDSLVTRRAYSDPTERVPNTDSNYTNSGARAMHGFEAMCLPRRSTVL